MPTEIGPFDGRKARRKRCDACVKRKIRCRDGIPCDNCKRIGRLCTMAIKPATFMPVFVSEKSANRPKVAKSAPAAEVNTITQLPRSLGLGEDNRALLYFFVPFSQMNVLLGNMSINNDILDLAKTSPALRDAIEAVATLHHKQQESFSIMLENGQCDTHRALQAYGRSVRQMQNHITSDTFLGDPSALWTTFLLGIFELMRDSTGTNWLSHFLHGTCTILRLQHPKSLAWPGEQNMRRRRFFYATRIFEIARSLIYTSATFLSKPEWIDTLAYLKEIGDKLTWHPKEALFDILPRVSDLGLRAMEFCEDAMQFPPDIQLMMTQSLADEGLILQSALQQWYVETAPWEQASPSHQERFASQSQPDTELLLAYAYFHSISIYLSGAYDYHDHWTWPDAPRAPILHRSQIEWHVSEVLRISQELLGIGISGVLLFFPLRVAGARAVDSLSRTTILNLLHTTVRRGFIVAEAFRVDLSELWESQIKMLGLR